MWRSTVRWLGSALILSTVLWFGVVVAFANVHADDRSQAPASPAVDGLLVNADFECASGYYTSTNAISQTIYIPNHWAVTITNGAPKLHSARTFFTGACDGDGHVERISGEDSLVLRSQDMETPPTPGKPFDAALFQSVQVVSGTAYSLSGWALSLCGGSAVPSDCPDDVYIAKMLGIDPLGGSDPEHERVVWVENRDNFVDDNDDRIGWANLRVAAQAESMTVTVFARLDSPFQHHGNHGFLDALSLMPAPTVELGQLPETVTHTQEITLSWQSVLPPEIDAIPGGTYRVVTDIDYRKADDSEWSQWVEGEESASGERLFVAACEDTVYQFRARARAEQPPAPPEGASPNQRYPGLWSEPVSVLFTSDVSDATLPPVLPFKLYLPLISAGDSSPEDC